MRWRRHPQRRQKFQAPVNYRKYFIFAGAVLGACIIISLILFIFGFANAYLLHQNQKSLVLPITSVVNISDYEKKLDEKNIRYDSVTVATSGASVIIQVHSGTIAYFSTGKDIDWQVNSLQQILDQLTIENRQPQYVDMRYDKPIVKF